MANSNQNYHVPPSKSEILVRQQTHIALNWNLRVTQGLNWPHVMQMGGFQVERATVKKKSNTLLLLISTVFMLISASHFLWADLIRERRMDQPLLCADKVQQRKSFSSHPVEQLLCSPLPELLFLQESLEAGAVNRPWVPQGSLSPVPGEGEPWLLYWPVSSQRSEQGKPRRLDPADSREGTFVCCI